MSMLGGTNIFQNLKKVDIIPEKRLDEIVIKECKEPLVELSSDKIIISKTARREIFDGNKKLYARKGVAERLKKASRCLPNGLQLKIFDAYRPYEFQRALFEEECARVKKENPGLDENSLRKIVFNLVFPPNLEQTTPAPHMTGGAVDLTLADRNGWEIDMGGGYCEFGKKAYTNARVSKKQRENRLLLLNTMIEAEFANFPGEWWHYMHGEREWAAYTMLITGVQVDAKYGGVGDFPMRHLK